MYNVINGEYRYNFTKTIWEGDIMEEIKKKEKIFFALGDFFGGAAPFFYQ